MADVKLTCTGSKNGVMFGERCGAEAAFMSQTGALCEACAQSAMAAIREGSCLLAMIADNKGIPRQRLLDQFRRIQ